MAPGRCGAGALFCGPWATGRRLAARLSYFTLAGGELVILKARRGPRFRGYLGLMIRISW
jgi:hypothetical protein